MGFQFLELISHSKEALIRATEGMLSTVIMQKKKKKNAEQNPAVWEEEVGGGRRHLSFMTG